MSFGNILSNLILGPLKLSFEVIFSLTSRVLSVGMSVAVLSLVVNFLALPLYRRADAIQEEAREKEALIAPMARHIKSAFRGDEQFMMLQTFYRQNDYSPLHILKGALPLLLQVPFFIAAYQFLSHLGSLQGASFGPIRDLGLPDRLIRIGSLSVNLLPVLMTVINLLSGALYTRGAPLKSKIQLVGMALIFLVLLYDSPAGLTFYWTLNNLFSLGKNLVHQKWPARKQGLFRALSIRWKTAPRWGSFVLSALLMTLLTGLLIPSAVVAASPQDFITYVTDPDPIWYVVNAFLLAAGFFLLWAGVYYALGSAAMKKGIETGLWILFGISVVNYLFFRNDLGTLTSTLKYEATPQFSAAQKLLNLGVLAPVAAGLLWLILKKENFVRVLALATALAMTGMSARNLYLSANELSRMYQAQGRNYEGAAEIPLSTEGKNVIVLMLDRAISSYLPCMLYEKPELKDIFSGFVYYPNTLSFGLYTNYGTPGLFGGYDYTVQAINARDDQLLKDKHNEALLLMPVLFSGEGYRVSVFDMPYPGDYSLKGDYSLYDGLPNTNARALVGAVASNRRWERPESTRLRNFFCYSISMTVPTVLYGTVYNMGYYNRPNWSASLFALQENNYTYFDQETTHPDYLAQYEVLTSLRDMTRIQESGENTLLLIDNGAPHEPMILPEPEYAPVRRADNEAYDLAHADRFLAGPMALEINEEEREWQMSHYEVNMASLLAVGDWLTFLKEAGVYDNTRIIIVADHGKDLGQIPEGLLKEGKGDIMGYNPLLMVKDFDAVGDVRTDPALMTNADVPSLATDGLISDPVNPFTGNPVDTKGKEGTLYLYTSQDFYVGKEGKTTFEPASWYAFHPGGETIYDQSQWTYLPQISLLPEE